MTGGILQKLYPDTDIQVTGFEDAKRVGDNNADLVISNVPFGNFSVFDKNRPEYSKQSKTSSKTSRVWLSGRSAIPESTSIQWAWLCRAT